MPTVEHRVEVVEDPFAATAFAYCHTCRWLGRVWEDFEVDDDQPPPSLEGAYRDRYGHIYLHRQLGHT